MFSYDKFHVMSQVGGVTVPALGEEDDGDNGGNSYPPIVHPQQFKKPVFRDLDTGSYWLSYKRFPGRVCIGYEDAQMGSTTPYYRVVSSYSIEWWKSSSPVIEYRWFNVPFWYDPVIPDEYLYVTFYGQGHTGDSDEQYLQYDQVQKGFVTTLGNGPKEAASKAERFRFAHVDANGVPLTNTVGTTSWTSPVHFVFNTPLERTALVAGLNQLRIRINCQPVEGYTTIRSVQTWFPRWLTFAEKLPETNPDQCLSDPNWQPLIYGVEHVSGTVKNLQSNQTTDTPRAGSGVWSTALSGSNRVVVPWTPDIALWSTVQWPVVFGFRGDGSFELTSDEADSSSGLGNPHNYTYNFAAQDYNWVQGTVVPNVSTRGFTISTQGSAGCSITSLIHLCTKDYLTNANNQRVTSYGGLSTPQKDLENFQYVGGMSYRREHAATYSPGYRQTPARRYTASNPLRAGFWDTVD